MQLPDTPYNLIQSILFLIQLICWNVKCYCTCNCIHVNFCFYVFFVFFSNLRFVQSGHGITPLFCFSFVLLDSLEMARCFGITLSMEVMVLVMLVVILWHIVMECMIYQRNLFKLHYFHPIVQYIILTSLCMESISSLKYNQFIHDNHLLIIMKKKIYQILEISIISTAL